MNTISTAFPPDNQTHDDNFHRCRPRYLQTTRRGGQNETPIHEPVREEDEDASGRVNETRDCERQKKERKGERRNGTFCGHSRLSALSGNASSLDPRPREQKKVLVNVNLLMVSALGSFQESRFFLFFFFFKMNNSRLKPLVTHIHASIVGTA